MSRATDALAQILQARSQGHDGQQLTHELMNDPGLLAIAPEPELRAALGTFTGTIAAPVLDGLRHHSDPFLSSVTIKSGTTHVERSGEREFLCNARPDSVATIGVSFRGSRLEAIGVLLFHELPHANSPVEVGAPSASRDEHVVIWWLESIMWAQQLLMDSQLVLAGDFGTGQLNARLLQLINSGDNDLDHAWFDPRRGAIKFRTAAT